MGGLMSAQALLSLEDAEAGVGVPGEKLAGDREPDDAAPDHDDVAALWSSLHRGRSYGGHH
jgi:hypothetical protein